MDTSISSFLFCIFLAFLIAFTSAQYETFTIDQHYDDRNKPPFFVYWHLYRCPKLPDDRQDSACVQEKFNVEQAKKYCNEKLTNDTYISHLVSLNQRTNNDPPTKVKEMNNWLGNYSQSTSDQISFWINLKRLDAEDKDKWKDLQKWSWYRGDEPTWDLSDTETEWADGQPDNKQGGEGKNEQCVYATVNLTGKEMVWNDALCDDNTVVDYLICESMEVEMTQKSKLVGNNNGASGSILDALISVMMITSFLT